MIYFSRLDTLRFIAFFLVFWSHNYVPCFNQWIDAPWRVFLNPFLYRINERNELTLFLSLLLSLKNDVLRGKLILLCKNI